MPTQNRDRPAVRVSRAASGRLGRAVRPPFAPALSTALVFLLASGCHNASHDGSPARSKNEQAKTEKSKDESGSTAGTRVVSPKQRDIRMMVVQPGTIQSFEQTPIYSRISGYVKNYRHNIGDLVKAGEVLLDMWIPDYIEQAAQKTAAVKRAQVQISVTQSALRAAEAKLETSIARISSAEAGVKRAQAAYTRWESEYKRLETLVNQRVIDVQVRDETYRQFEEAMAARDQASAMVSESHSARDQAAADRDRARVDVEAARADLVVAQSEERYAQVIVEYGQIKAPFPGVITQRNVSPGDYLQPGGAISGLPLLVLEQTDPVRIFVGVPELASGFVKNGDKALVRFQAIPGVAREGTVVRSGFSLNPSTRTLQTEIDLPNSDGHLHPGWYVTVTIAVDRKNVWTLPSNAIGFGGAQSYFVYLEVKGGKPVRTPVIVGPSDDTHTEVIRKFKANTDTNEWPHFDGSERVIVGNFDTLASGQPVQPSGNSSGPAATSSPSSGSADTTPAKPVESSAPANRDAPTPSPSK